MTSPDRAALATSTDEEALALVMNILERLADTARDGLHGDTDPDAALCEINNLTRDTIDALAKRTMDPAPSPYSGAAVAWQFRQRSAVGKGPQSQAPWCDWSGIGREDYDRYIREPNKLIEVRSLYAHPTLPRDAERAICATPPEDLLDLADAIEEARNAYLDAISRGPGGEVEKRTLQETLWNDKGTFAPALRLAAYKAVKPCRDAERETIAWEDMPETRRLLKVIKEGVECSFDESNVTIFISDESDPSVGLDGGLMLSLSCNYEVIPVSLLRDIKQAMGDNWERCVDLWRQTYEPSTNALPSIPPREGMDGWLPVYLYPDDNSIVLVANPDEGRMPVVAWKIEDKWFKYDLTERGPLDPQPTLWTTWPKLPKAALSPSPTSVMPDEGEAGT